MLAFRKGRYSVFYQQEIFKSKNPTIFIPKSLCAYLWKTETLYVGHLWRLHLPQKWESMIWSNFYSTLSQPNLQTIRHDVKYPDIKYPLKDQVQDCGNSLGILELRYVCFVGQDILSWCRKEPIVQDARTSSGSLDKCFKYFYWLITA